MRLNLMWPAVSGLVMLLIMIGRLLLWSAVIYLGWRYLSGRREGLPNAGSLVRPESQSLAILRQRLAAGEISIDEFEDIKQRLMQKNHE